MIHEKKRTKEGRKEGKEGREGRGRLRVQVKIRDQFSRTDQFQSRGNRRTFASILISSYIRFVYVSSFSLCEFLKVKKKERNKKFLSCLIKFWFHGWKHFDSRVVR